MFLDQPDPHIVRGIGKLGITGLSAGIANAIHHATGKRIGDLLITIEKLID